MARRHWERTHYHALAALQRWVEELPGRLTALNAVQQEHLTQALMSDFFIDLCPRIPDLNGSTD